MSPFNGGEIRGSCFCPLDTHQANGRVASVLVPAFLGETNVFGNGLDESQSLESFSLKVGRLFVVLCFIVGNGKRSFSGRSDSNGVSALRPCRHANHKSVSDKRHKSATSDSQKSKLALWLTTALCQIATSSFSHLTLAVYSGI